MGLRSQHTTSGKLFCLATGLIVALASIRKHIEAPLSEHLAILDMKQNKSFFLNIRSEMEGRFW